MFQAQHFVPGRGPAGRPGAGPADHHALPSRTPSTIEALESRRLLSAALTASLADAPTSLVTGSADQVTVQLTNTGAATTRGRVSVQLFASADGLIDAGATPLGTLSRQVSLAAGRSAAVPVQFDLPATLTGSTEFLVTRVSGAGIASSTAATPAALPVQQGYVDLTGTITQLPAGALEFGARPAPARVTVRITNQGNAVAVGRVSVVVYLSGDGQIGPTSAPLKVTSPKAVRLLPGQSILVGARVRAPNFTTPGAYYLVAQVRGSHGISERDLGNNIAASSSQVPVVPSPRHYGHRYGWEVGGVFYPFGDAYYEAGYPVTVATESGYVSGPVDTGSSSSGGYIGGPSDSGYSDSSGSSVSSGDLMPSRFW
jgi:hypothetical protein